MSNVPDQNKILEPDSWVENYGDYLYTYAYYRVSSAEKAEDLVQETFLSALKSQDKFKGKSSEKTWLVSILKRKIVDHYRKQSRSKEDVQGKEDFPFIKEGPKKGKWLSDRAPSDWEEKGLMEIDKEEFYRILEFCMSLLPSKWKSVFYLKTMEELESNKICKEIGISSSNLWVILHRARLRLRECFERNWLD